MLAERSDLDALREQFHQHGRVRVHGVLQAAFARELEAALQQWTQWNVVTRLSGQHRAFELEAFAGLPEAVRQELTQAVHAEAQRGFQYFYERYPLHEAGARAALDSELLRELDALLRSVPFVQLLRDISGRRDIDFVDSQLTRYRPGHFLTAHDDHAEGQGRIAAYVLSLTPAWSVDYGGLLQFIDAEGHVEQAWTPGFNTLSVFRVPCAHAVSAVAPFAPLARHSVTGWARTASAP